MTDDELRARLADLAESGDPWADPLPAVRAKADSASTPAARPAESGDPGTDPRPIAESAAGVAMGELGTDPLPPAEPAVAGVRPIVNIRAARRRRERLFWTGVVAAGVALIGGLIWLVGPPVAQSTSDSGSAAGAAVADEAARGLCGLPGVPVDPGSSDVPVVADVPASVAAGSVLSVAVTAGSVDLAGASVQVLVIRAGRVVAVSPIATSDAAAAPIEVPLVDCLTGKPLAPGRYQVQVSVSRQDGLAVQVAATEPTDVTIT